MKLLWNLYAKSVPVVGRWDSCKCGQNKSATYHAFTKCLIYSFPHIHTLMFACMVLFVGQVGLFGETFDPRVYWEIQRKFVTCEPLIGGSETTSTRTRPVTTLLEDKITHSPTRGVDDHALCNVHFICINWRQAADTFQSFVSLEYLVTG